MSKIEGPLTYFDEVSNLVILIAASQYDTSGNTSSLSNAVRATSESFPDMLLKLDNAIAYLSAHPTYIDSEEYISKASAALVHALTIAKNHITTSLSNMVMTSLFYLWKFTQKFTYANLYFLHFRPSSQRLEMGRLM